jgi:hypothetical protein
LITGRWEVHGNSWRTWVPKKKKKDTLSPVVDAMYHDAAWEERRDRIRAVINRGPYERLSPLDTRVKRMTDGFKNKCNTMSNIASAIANIPPTDGKDLSDHYRYRVHRNPETKMPWLNFNVTCNCVSKNP